MISTLFIAAAVMIQPAPDATPEEIVDAQVDAYLDRDLDAFMAFYSEDAVVAHYRGDLIATGHEEMRELYAPSFENQDIQLEIANRMVLGNIVIDHEQLRRSPDADPFEAIVIYMVEDGLITKADQIYLEAAE